MIFASVGIASSAILSVLLTPKPEWFKNPLFPFYYPVALMPATLIIFGALPAVEAQTRLLLGASSGLVSG